MNTKASAMNEKYCQLTRDLIAVLEKTNDQEIDSIGWSYIDEAFIDYGFEKDYPDWMSNLLSSILNKRYTEAPVYFDISRENDFSGALAEIESDYLKNYEDCGEGIEWDFPEHDVSIFLCREVSGSKYFYTARPYKGSGKKKTPTS